MRRLKMAVVGLGVVVMSTGTLATPADACMGEICDAINTVCSKTITKGKACVK